MGTGGHHPDVGRRVLAESIELQHLVAAEIAITPLPPISRHRRRPVALDVLLVALVVLALAAAGYFVV
jgi:hypothetical protein